MIYALYSREAGEICKIYILYGYHRYILYLTVELLNITIRKLGQDETAFWVEKGKQVRG